jgi:hypothetical protein
MAELIITGIYIFILVANLIANDATADSIERHEYELKYVKESSSKLKNITLKISDNALRKQAENVFDLIHSSQSKSHQSVRNLELEVIELIETLDFNISSNRMDTASDTINRIAKVGEERNLQLRTLN